MGSVGFGLQRPVPEPRQEPDEPAGQVFEVPGAKERRPGPFRGSPLVGSAAASSRYVPYTLSLFSCLLCIHFFPRPP
jgi:hypothetical protein